MAARAVPVGAFAIPDQLRVDRELRLLVVAVMLEMCCACCWGVLVGGGGLTGESRG